jgi:hypothetical protein
MAIGDSNADLQQLVDDLVDNARQWTGRYDLTPEWDLDGDAPAGKTVRDMVAEAGVTLPATVPLPDAGCLQSPGMDCSAWRSASRRSPVCATRTAPIGSAPGICQI